MATPTYHTGDHVRSLVHRHGVLPISPGDVGTVTGSGIRNYIETLCPGAHAGGRRRRAHQLRPRRNRRGALTRRRFPTDARPGRLPAAVRARPVVVSSPLRLGHRPATQIRSPSP